MANGDWFYARNNQQQGPVALPALQDMARSGQLQPTDLVWREGMPSWLPAQQVAELFAPQAAPGFAVPGTPGAAPQVQYGGYYPTAQQPRYQAEVPTYLVQSILVTLFCCVPFGIVSIVYAAQVNSKLAAGDYAGAVDASGKAKMWSMISLGVGLLAAALWFVMVAIGAANH